MMPSAVARRPMSQHPYETRVNMTLEHGHGLKFGRTSGMGRISFRILLVEDHPDTLVALAKVLRSLGHLVTLASTYREAARLCEQPYDVLMADLGLPDGDGADLPRLLRMHWPRARCVAVTGYAMENDVHRIKAAGFNFHLFKPVSIAQISDVLDVCLLQPDIADRSGDHPDIPQ